jgi:hypothetical protein
VGEASRSRFSEVISLARTSGFEDQILWLVIPYQAEPMARVAGKDNRAKPQIAADFSMDSVESATSHAAAFR